MPKPIVFQLPHPTEDKNTFRITIEPHNPITQCTVEEQYGRIIEYCWRLRAFGLSYCRPGDVYDAETGNRLALTSALRKIDNEKVRKAIWDEYFKLFPPSERSKSTPVADGVDMRLLAEILKQSLIFAIDEKFKSVVRK
ncbi:MAG TPA: hypothetical protein VFF68_10075 [Anaerolineaceae bacterium]|nr:hypothetical protein [Anaerolineaceae bacterium]